MIFNVEQKTENWKHPVRRVSLQGHLETSTLPKMEEAIDEYLKEGPWYWAVDLSELEYISSAGIAAFMKVKQTVENKGGALCFFDPTPSVEQTLRLLEMHDFFNLFKKEVDAREKF